jgi:hypothetical protein
MGDLLDPAAVTVEDTLSLVSQRYGEVGGLPRMVLGSGTVFADWCRAKNSITSVKFFKDFEDNSAFSITDSAKYFMSPTISPDVEVPSLDNWHWQFFTNKHALAVDRLCDGVPAHVRFLRDYGLTYQVHERIVEAALRGDVALAPRFHLASWEWHMDVNGKVCTDLAKMPDGFGVRKDKVSFYGPVLHRAVDKIDETVLYKSTSAQMKVADMFVVSHSAKQVFMIQVSAQRPQEHVFNLDNIRVVMAASGLGNNLDYKMVLVYVTDSSTPISGMKGMIVRDGKNKYSLQDAEDLLKCNLSGFIVRAHLSSASIVHTEAALISPQPSSIVFAINKKKKTKYHLDSNCFHLKKSGKTVNEYTAEAVANQHQCKACALRLSASNINK